METEAKTVVAVEEKHDVVRTLQSELLDGLCSLLTSAEASLLTTTPLEDEHSSYLSLIQHCAAGISILKAPPEIDGLAKWRKAVDEVLRPLTATESPLTAAAEMQGLWNALEEQLKTFETKRDSLDRVEVQVESYPAEALSSSQKTSADLELPARKSVLLVVDDEPVNREVLSRRLRRDGHHVVCAESGSQALDMLCRCPCDLILLDMQMPGLSGLETLDQVKSSSSSASPVIMVTAVDDSEVVAECLTKGADDYIIKPFSPVLLRARVHAVLARKHLQDQQQLQHMALEKASADAQGQTEQMQRLLENILPKTVATELREAGAVQPMYFEDVTVAFADIVGFTTSTESMAADDLVEALHEYFTACDRIMDRYGLEKLKTIGDSYMFAGGIPEHQSSHPIDSIFAAMEMIEALAEISSKRALPWRLRVGMHIGSVIAGVVGIHKFAFDIWGNAVNFASRVEACGEAGRINLSSAMHLRVRDFFECEKRLEVLTKDGNACEMYFVEGIARGLKEKEPLTPQAAFGRRYYRYFRKKFKRHPGGLFDAAAHEKALLSDS